MDFGGIIAGALAGGGAAVQDISANRLEQQREQALLDLERKYQRENIDYEYGKKSEIQQAEAAAEERAAIRDAQIEIGVDAAKKANEARINGSGTEDYDTAYSRAIDRANRQYSGQTDIASSAVGFGAEGVSQPEYNQLVADNLRAEARATDDPNISRRLMRQADEMESGGTTGGESGLIDPSSVFGTQ